MKDKIIRLFAFTTFALLLSLSAECALLPVVPQPAEWQPSSDASFIAPKAWRTASDLPGVRFERVADGNFSPEEHEIAIAATGVVVRAADEIGFARAKATLTQLAEISSALPAGTIRDRPKYRMRGFMLDVGRKPYSMAFLRSVAKTLAYYKMNLFHIHLNDDGDSLFTGREHKVRGFRIASDRYPGLASADQHYTKDEFRAFVKECAAMGVTVVPEFDSSAHEGAFRRYMNGLNPPQDFSITNPRAFTNAVAFMEGLFDEYLGGDDPVFAGPYVHIGMDEFGSKHIDAYRAYERELFRIVRKYGKKVCMWSSREHPDDPYGEVLVDFWSGRPTAAYNPVKMMQHGYDTLCVYSALLYIVPAAGYYNDYLRVRHLYENWEPCMFGRGYNVEPDNPRLFGGKFAVWNDLSGSGVSEDDTFDRIFPAVQTLSQKMWSGTRDDEDWQTFSEIAARHFEAPGENLADRLTGPGGTVAPSDKAVGWTQDGGYTVSFEICPQAGRKLEETLFDDGFTRVTLTADGRIGFFRDGLGHTFAARLAAGRWTRLVFTGNADGVNLFVDDVFSESTLGLCKLCPNWNNGGYPLCLRSPRTMHFPLVRKPFAGALRDLSVTTGYEKRRLTIDADQYRGTNGVADVTTMADVINRSGADEVTLLNMRRDQPIEGNGDRIHKGEADVLAFRCCMKGRYGTLTKGNWKRHADGFEKTTATMSRKRTMTFD